MVRTLIALPLTLFMLTLSSIYAEESAKIAICDVRQVVQTLDTEEVATQKLKTKERVLADRLMQLRRSYLDEVEQERKQLGDSPTQEDLQRISRLELRLNSKFKKNRDESVQEFESYKKQIVAEIRKDVSEKALKIAVEQGFTIVLDGSSDFVLAFTPKTDITHLVIEAFQEQAKRKDVAEAKNPVY